MFKVFGSVIASSLALTPAHGTAHAVTAQAGTRGHATKTVPAGSEWTLAATTRLAALTIGAGSIVKSTDGHSLTLTVNGVQRDIAPGSYKGDVVLTVSSNNIVDFSIPNGPKFSYPFRHAVYVDGTGIVAEKSVLPAVRATSLTGTVARNLAITSRGQSFNGVYVSGGADYTINRAKIDLQGNSTNDFAGYGAALMATGKGTRLTVDHADIVSRGVVRTAVIAGDGSRVLVKNSRIQGFDGILPAGFRHASSPGHMWTAPWMLGIGGNMRATSVIGAGPTATYLNSAVSAQSWGVLSTDSCTDANLVTINSTATITGSTGYGAYADGPTTTDTFYGATINVPDFAAITTGGALHFGASTPEHVAEINKRLGLGLTDAERGAIVTRQTLVNSKRFGIMLFFNDNASATIRDGTVFKTGQAVFLVRGSGARIDVDGAGGARLEPANGVLLQVIDRDRAIPQKDPATGINYNDRSVYTEPYASYADIVKDDSHDVTATDKQVVGDFRNLALNGDFFNAITGIKGNQNYASRNLVVNLHRSRLTGVISASFARHAKRSFGIADREMVGEVTNTPHAAVNNGVVVSLDAASTWRVTGASYLTRLDLAEGAVISAPAGRSVRMTVNGQTVPIAPGTYTGAVALTLI